MKKLFAISVIAACASAFAALDFSGAKALPVITPATVSEGATNSVVTAVSGLRGVGEVVVFSGSAYGRGELSVALSCTNAVSGGWYPLVAKSFSETNAAIFRVAFPAEYITRDIKVDVGSIGADSAVSAMILSY